MADIEERRTIQEELPSSKLGTQEYWDKFYSLELNNFSDSKDEGEVWFGHNRMMKVVRWITNNTSIERTHSVIDIGCGNGVMLLELADEDFTDLCGVDYSPKAIELAQNIAQEHDKDIRYAQVDFLDVKSVEEALGGRCFHVCHDKGTYDAISLRPDDAKEARSRYMECLKSVMKTEGYFVITSCNWTLDELQIHFGNDFKFLKHIPAPSFQYGGSTGSTVTTVVFTKL